MKLRNQALLVAFGMIAIAILAVFEIVPEEVAQFTPLAVFALFPQMIGRKRGRCASGSCNA